MNPEQPKYRPQERFWPYAELPEQPTDEEIVSLDPDLQEALFGAKPRPFSITIVFPSLDLPNLHYRARFWSSDAERLRDLFEIVGRSDATDVLIDDRPVPYARELWLPLVWLLIPR
jgi:hypothetical protein